MPKFAGFAPTKTKTKKATFLVDLFKISGDAFVLLESLSILINRQNEALTGQQIAAEITIAYMLLGKDAHDFRFEAFGAIAAVEKARESLNAQDVSLLIKMGENINVLPNRAIVRNGSRDRIWEITIDLPLEGGNNIELKDLHGKARNVSVKLLQVRSIH